MSFSKAVPITTRSAPALKAASILFFDLIPPPTIKGIHIEEATALIIFASTGTVAPEPASR